MSKVYMSNFSQMLHFLIIFWKGNLYLFVCHIFLSCGLYFLCFENVANISYQTLSLKSDRKKNPLFCFVGTHAPDHACLHTHTHTDTFTLLPMENQQGKKKNVAWFIIFSFQYLTPVETDCRNLMSTALWS